MLSTRVSCLNGILFDLGVSSIQLDEADRGFSFQRTGRLDMRMDQDEKGSITAYDVVNTYSAKQLAEVFFLYGEERHSRRIARRIVEARASLPIETTTQLAEIVECAVPRRYHPRSIHPATRVFQAIRIEVNDELHHLGETLERAVLYLREGGRICVISFHSLEDRIVKRTFTKLAKGCQCPPKFPECVCGITPSLKILSRKPIVATPEEQQQNPRSRSAKLRVAEKIAG
jgi:16S rRNA (cytosine1402-N4)-methyltransferase